MSNTATQKAALWVGIVFLLGAALGGMLGYLFAHRSYAAAPPALTDAQHRAQKLEQLRQELTLTPDQEQKIDAIMADVQGQYKTIHQTIEPQMDEARQKGRARIRTVLTPDQLPKFELFLKRLDEERKKSGLNPR